MSNALINCFPVDSMSYCSLHFKRKTLTMEVHHLRISDRTCILWNIRFITAERTHVTRKFTWGTALRNNIVTITFNSTRSNSSSFRSSFHWSIFETVETYMCAGTYLICLKNTIAHDFEMKKQIRWKAWYSFAQLHKVLFLLKLTVEMSRKSLRFFVHYRRSYYYC